MPFYFKPLLFLTAFVSAGALVLGPYLYLKVDDTADATSGLVCSLGKVISKSPIVPRTGETPREFRIRAQLIRRFTTGLRCDGEAVELKIPPESRELLDDGPPRL